MLNTSNKRNNNYKEWTLKHRKNTYHFLIQKTDAKKSIKVE